MKLKKKKKKVQILSDTASIKFSILTINNRVLMVGLLSEFHSFIS